MLKKRKQKNIKKYSSFRIFKNTIKSFFVKKKDDDIQKVILSTMHEVARHHNKNLDDLSMEDLKRGVDWAYKQSKILKISNVKFSTLQKTSKAAINFWDFAAGSVSVITGYWWNLPLIFVKRQFMKMISPRLKKSALVFLFFQASREMYGKS